MATKARVFFLFLLEDKFRRMDLWEAFFADADHSSFRVLVHCKQQSLCRTRLAGKNRIGISQVETVPSFYCHDLVTPMVQLLKAATAESRSPGDKFAFLSDATLPVKPFPILYNALSADQNSDICVAPADQWLYMRYGPSSSRRALLVKHSQWAVLNRDHAGALVQRWAEVGSKRGAWLVGVFG